VSAPLLRLPRVRCDRPPSSPPSCASPHTKPPLIPHMRTEPEYTLITATELADRHFHCLLELVVLHRQLPS
jgi:hypothetical protein